MGLQDAIGYKPGSRNWFRSLLLWVFGTRPGSWLVSKTITPVDSAIYRLSRGRYTATATISGLPVVMLTTVGAKSGQQRTIPLVGIPVGADLAVIGSNFGQAQSPGWVYNLRANPNAKLTYRDTVVPVTARLADEAEYQEAFAAGSKINPTFNDYRERVTEREIPVFMLMSPG